MVMKNGRIFLVDAGLSENLYCLVFAETAQEVMKEILNWSKKHKVKLDADKLTITDWTPIAPRILGCVPAAPSEDEWRDGSFEEGIILN